MPVWIAYLGVILIWSTTPLAIHWSSVGAGFLFAVASRMALGAAVCLLIVAVWHRHLPLSRQALHTYVAGAVGMYGAMLCVYWASQFIPSGLISVLFGLSPLFTGALAAAVLREHALTPVRLVGIGLGITGLAMVFGVETGISEAANYGIAGVLVSTLLHSISTVWVKRIGSTLPAITVNTGALTLATGLYVLTWAATGAELPAHVPPRAVAAIVYLGIVGSVLGFALYFYALRRLPATHMALIPLITPVLALLLGRTLNHEAMAAQVWVGTACISAGLLVYQFGDRALRQRLQRRPST